MVSVDPRASRAWSADAELYERGRPGFPREAVAIAMGGLGLVSGADVLDLAAGTGKLTRALVAAQLSVVAVEPLRSMRAVFARVCPGVTVVDGIAERIPLSDGSMDAVFVGQAVHWFDVPIACREIGRVLKAGGGVALLRNDWLEDDRAPSWLAELRVRLGSHAPGEEPARSPYGGRWQQALSDSAVFEALQRARVEHEEICDVERVLAQIASWSFLGVSGVERARLTHDCECLLRAHAVPEAEATIAFPYRTEVLWACRAARS